MISPLILAGLVALSADPHESANPVYKQLRSPGLEVGADAPVVFPAPLCPDGLSGADQQALIRKVIGDDFNFSEFTRNSPVAPNKLVLREVTPAAKNSLTRQAEVVFIAHGDMKKLANKDFLDRVLDLNRKEGKATSIPASKLKERELVIKDDKHEGFGHLVFNLIDKVELTVTGHSIWSETDESIIIAGRVDRRFADDTEFPNMWKPITKGRDGKNAVGKPSPYDGAGYYVKITRLKEPAGVLFVEGHILFSEPEGWFQGTNLLRAKLPPVIQSQVRNFRRELLKVSAP